MLALIGAAYHACSRAIGLARKQPDGSWVMTADEREAARSALEALYQRAVFGR